MNGVGFRFSVWIRVERDDDLIPDGEPLLGRLDDVLLIELAWPAFAEESEDYRDFCDYRDHEHPGGDAARKRATWLRDRLDELALWQHRVRVHEMHYVDAPFGDRQLRLVCPDHDAAPLADAAGTWEAFLAASVAD